MTIEAGILIYGRYEAMTVFGDINITVSGFTNVSDIVSAGTTTVSVPTGLLSIYSVSRDDIDLLASDGSTYSSSTSHVLSTTLAGTSGEVTPTTNNFGSTPIATADLTNTTGSTTSILNFDNNSTPTPPSPCPPCPSGGGTVTHSRRAIIYFLAVANTENDLRLPIYWPDWYRFCKPVVCSIKERKQCEKQWIPGRCNMTPVITESIDMKIPWRHMGPSMQNRWFEDLLQKKGVDNFPNQEKPVEEVVALEIFDQNSSKIKNDMNGEVIGYFQPIWKEKLDAISSLINGKISAWKDRSIELIYHAIYATQSHFDQLQNILIQTYQHLMIKGEVQVEKGKAFLHYLKGRSIVNCKQMIKWIVEEKRQVSERTQEIYLQMLKSTQDMGHFFNEWKGIAKNNCQNIYDFTNEKLKKIISNSVKLLHLFLPFETNQYLQFKDFWIDDLNRLYKNSQRMHERISRNFQSMWISSYDQMLFDWIRSYFEFSEEEN